MRCDDGLAQLRDQEISSGEGRAVVRYLWRQLWEDDGEEKMGRGQLPDRHRNGAWWERIGRMVGFILCAPMRVVLHGSAHPPSHTRDAPTAHMHEHTPK